METTETDAVVTAPPATDEATGIAMQGDYPFNHRLRAEALAKAGKATDPHNLVTAELIADAGDRLEREKAAAPSLKWTRDELAKHAASIPVEVASDATKGDILKAIEGDPAPQTEA